MHKQWWLLIPGIICLYFSNGRFSIPLAAWLFPLFLLPISRHHSSRFTGLIFPLLVGGILQAAFWNFTSTNPGSILFYVPFFAGLIYGLTFLVDRWFWRNSQSFKSTLFFPLLFTTVDFTNSLFNPFGTTGVLGYSQFGFLPFAQLAAITGMWGLSFMVTWFGSVFHWAVCDPFHKKKSGILIYTSIFSAILLFGFIRLAIPLNNNTVAIAGLHVTDKERDGKAFWETLAKKDTVNFNTASASQIENLTNATKAQAANGAKIVLWSEMSPVILKTKADKLQQYLSGLADSLNIYLIANPYIATIDDARPENKLWMFSPTGELLLTHYKYGGNFIEGSVEGDRKLKKVSTSFGNLSGLVCWDADFPGVAKQLGQQKTDIVFNPASDWREIDPLHTRVAVFRAIENGCSWVRQTRNGLSIITDPRGKTISAMDHFETTQWLNTGNVPTKRIWTLYPLIGDLFGWLAIFSLAAFLFYRLTKCQ